MPVPYLPGLSKHDLKQVPEDGHRSLNPALSERTENGWSEK